MKFSDPNYYLLKQYFDVLVAERNGTDKSVLLGPGKTVVSNGGLYSILYENNADRGYVGHRFKIKEITGNRFKMTYEGLESTFSVASSAFGIGNEMYFRKDSFFHYWLARSDQDDLYHDFCNQKKTFLFFGKIWPVSNETNTYAIEFQGLKDFALQALPQHQQTVNIEEWLKVYWDQIHHEAYNLTKNSWSLLDAKEVDMRWLGYIAGMYNIDISEDVLNELPLREWVDNLPYFLKRIGTYNALYIVWKVLSANTNNNLNVYERWGEWCEQDLDQNLGTIANIEYDDHNFLESYGTQPSGGAGTYYYSRYNPDNYPIHTLEAPAGDCVTFAWDVSTGENFLVFNKIDLNCSVGNIYQDEFYVTGYDPTGVNTKVMFLSGGSYTGDFTHSIGVEMNSSVTEPSNIVFWALSNEVAQMSDHSGDYILCSFEVSGGSRYFKLVESESGIENSSKSSYAYAADTPYYLVIDRSGTTLRARVYNNERRWAGDLLETFTLSLSDADTYSNLYALNGRRITGYNEWYGKIYKLSLDNTYLQTIASSGNAVITPHYKVQIDLSNEPLGDVFDDSTIISENVIDEFVRNFEYVRPVSKYAHYEELVAPLAKINRTTTSVPLYSLSSNGYMNTYFTGSQSISAGGGGLGIDSTYAHFQQFASKTWTVTHNLDSPYLLVQPWIFIGTSSANAKLVRPKTIRRVDDNSIEILFNESLRGVAAVAVSGSFGVGFIEHDYEDSPSTSWSIDHNLDTDTPSGYSSPPGPVVNHWNTSGGIFIPNVNDLANDDLLITTWSPSAAVSGSSIVRRADYIHTQSDPSSKWEVNHKLNSWVIIQCFDITTGEEMSPDKIKIIDVDNLEIHWSENTRGYAHLIQVARNKVLYSPYECDILGLGICANTLGYWKIGTGNSSLWNPFIQNDLESPVTSGTYHSIEEDDYHGYVDFIVPSDYADVSISEIGLFNYLDELVLYSRCSELFKPKDVQCYFHYRIDKLESSSSSSSSSSVSSSSSSASSS